MKLAGGAFGGKGLAARARAKVSKRNREKEAAAKKAAMETARRKQEDAAEADKARMLARANKGGGGGGGGGDDAGGGDGGGAGAEQTPGPVGDTVSLDHETREIAEGVKVGDPMAVKGRPASSTKAVAKRKLQRADSKSGMTLSRKSIWIDLKVSIPPRPCLLFRPLGPSASSPPPSSPSLTSVPRAPLPPPPQDKSLGKKVGRQSNGHQLNRAGSHNHFQDVVASAEDLRRKKMAEKRAEQQVVIPPSSPPPQAIAASRGVEPPRASPSMHAQGPRALHACVVCSCVASVSLRAWPWLGRRASRRPRRRTSRSSVTCGSSAAPTATLASRSRTSTAASSSPSCRCFDPSPLPMPPSMRVSPPSLHS